MRNEMWATAPTTADSGWGFLSCEFWAAEAFDFDQASLKLRAGIRAGGEVRQWSELFEGPEEFGRIKRPANDPPRLSICPASSFSSLATRLLTSPRATWGQPTGRRAAGRRAKEVPRPSPSQICARLTRQLSSFGQALRLGK